MSDQDRREAEASHADASPADLADAERLHFLYHVHMYMTEQIQFADVKASGVLVAEGAVLAYVVTMLWYGWPGIRDTPAALPALLSALACIVMQGIGVVASLLSVWPRVWKSEPQAQQRCSLIDFYVCSSADYGQLIRRATVSQLIDTLAEAVSRSAAVAARKHALMRIAVAFTLIGGLPAVVVLWLLRPMG